MIKIRQETMRDIEAREALLDSCFGADRFQKTCERLREGRVPAQGLSLVIERDGAIIGTVRLWHVSLGANRPALMLGPIAIAPSCQSLGLGGKLMREAIGRANGAGPQGCRAGRGRCLLRAIWLLPGRDRRVVDAGPL